MNSGRSKVCLSIVSHGQGALVGRLLDDLARHDDGSFDIVLTLNIPEDESFLQGRQDRRPLRIIRNPSPKGFGANHNAAFVQACAAPMFAVLNPDLRLPSWPVPLLVQALEQTAGAGAAAPLVLSPQGLPEDSVRRFPTMARLARRVLLRQRKADYAPAEGRRTVDWAAGMFVLFDSVAYRRVGGYDEAYFMYMEDADIARRMAAQGLLTVWEPAARVLHDARRASRRHLRPLLWHLASAWRFTVVRSLVEKRLPPLAQRDQPTP